MNKSLQKIRVLVVDDSGLARDLIGAILGEAPDITVVGEAADGLEAVTKVAALKPDVVTMDIEMPVMGGLEAIERIMADIPVPILVVTALTGVKNAFAAISKGAMDVVEKPDLSLENANTLLRKIRFLANVNISAHIQARKALNGPIAKEVKPAVEQLPARRILAVAASTGGPHAINAILQQLPATFPLPIVIAQHIATGFTRGMALWLNSGTFLAVKVAEHGDTLSPGHVYINPAEQSMRVTRQGSILLEEPAAGQIYNPSCNALLSSVATSFRQGAIGLILSGMGDDGVAGMQAIRQAGGVTLAQDASSSVVYGMNRLAIEQGHIDKALPLADLPGELLRRAGASS